MGSSSFSTMCKLQEKVCTFGLQNKKEHGNGRGEVKQTRLSPRKIRHKKGGTWKKKWFEKRKGEFGVVKKGILEKT